MAIAWSDVVLIAPELSAVPSGTQTAILATVGRLIDPDAWLDLADDGTKYLAAHMGSIALGGGGPGPVIEEKLGPFERAYGEVNADPLLSTTKYGVFYQNLVRMLPSSIGFVP